MRPPEDQHSVCLPVENSQGGGEQLNPIGASQNKVTQGFSWSDIVALVLAHRRELIIANIVAVLGALAAVPIPMFIPLLVDELVLKLNGPIVPFLQMWMPDAFCTPMGYVVGITLLTVLLRAFTLALNTFQYQQFTQIAKQVVYKMRISMLSVIQKIAMSEYESLGSGTVSSHFVTDLNSIDEFIGGTISRVLVAVLTIVGTAIVLLWMHWPLALLVMFFHPLVVYSTLVMGRTVKSLKKSENKAVEVFQQGLIEVLDGIHQIRAANRERHYIAQLMERAGLVKNHAIEYEWRSSAATRASFIIFQLGLDLFRGAAVLVVLFSDLTVGQMFAVFGYLWFMMAPVQEILEIQYKYYAANAALGRINRLLTKELEPHFATQRDPFAGKDTLGITIEDLHFAYREHDAVLNGVSLSIQAGAKIAIVGASGGGKSTLVQVILGMYQPQSGRVLFDGVPFDQIGHDLVRENVATVLQHPALFNDTVRANLTMGKTISDEVLWMALDIAQLKTTIEDLPQGLATLLGRNGVKFSGGQRQRLAIARMVLSNPKVVILDEATSALDAETEFQVHHRLQDFLRGKTTIIIAHRLSAVKQADHVYVFENGQVSEQGGHQELIDQKGLYAKLYGFRQ